MQPRPLSQPSKVKRLARQDGLDIEAVLSASPTLGMNEDAKVVVVTGDVTMDWNLARIQRSKEGPAAWSADDCTRVCWQRGGAALLADLIEAIAKDLREAGKADHVVRTMNAPREPVHPDDSRFHHSPSMWFLFKYAEKSTGDAPAWRVEEFLGLDHCATDGSSEATQWMRVVDDTPDAELVVLDDADLGFRERKDLWPQAITAPGRHPWILLKMARPVAQGSLWKHLRENHSSRLIVVIPVNDLRRTEVQISRELSWERTAQDVVWELVHNPRVNALSSCAHVMVSFNTAGVVLLSRQEPSQIGKVNACRGVLFFDPLVIEGMWEQEHPGGMIGYTTCLTASIARQLMLSEDDPNIHQAIQSGFAAMRALHLEGYGQRGADPKQVRLAFPVEVIAGELARDSAQFAVADIQDPVRFLTGSGVATEKPPEDGFWTLLKDRYRDNLHQVAERIVIEGPEVALRGVPLGKFGGLLTVDRRETEAFRSIRSLVNEYCRQAQKRPLSIAVFGAPGSGKSFGITEVSRSFLPELIQPLEFNLAQFGSPDGLVDALHQVRDVALAGKIPLVFWDEFDSPLAGKPLGWLRYFLAPMQDGRFQEGQITHPVGRAIFVFAGGTCERMEDFGQGLDPVDFRAAKGPDFVSRLRGYVNILGPDPQKDSNGTGADPYYIIRRAILLRSILQRNAPHLFQKSGGRGILNIDRGVLRAFLGTPRYRHGVRSIEAIVAMSLLAGKTGFERSGLPSEAQLDLHVDGRDFLALVQQMDLEGELLEKLAEAAHEVFCDGLRASGYKFGPQTDEVLKTHSSLRPYAELPEHEKEQNRGNVRDIANKLARIGYVMIHARGNEPPFGFPGDDLEMLAEMEHERWMTQMLRQGWQYAPEKDKIKKLHDALLPWDKLPEKQKEKDRALIRGIPKILAKAGYAILKSRAGPVGKPVVIQEA